MAFGNAAVLGIDPFQDTAPLEAWPGQSNEDTEAIIRAVYKQVMGNGYVMKSERLVVPESLFKRGEISVREFVRQVAKSSLYRSRFFENRSTFRAIELNFKHLLGRAPDGYAEVKIHSDLIDKKGFEADIDSYIDSDEYLEAFGENIVPYYRGFKSQNGLQVLGFTNLFALLRGPGSSDYKGSFAGNSSALNKYIIQETPIAVKPPSASGGSKGWTFQEPPLSARTRLGAGATEEGKIYRIEVTGYSSPNAVNKIPKIRRSNKVYLVPFEKLSEEYQRIHRQGGVIASITAIN